MKNLRFILLLCIAVISGTINAQSQKELGQLMRERNEYYFTLSVNDPAEIQTINGICSVDGIDGRTVVCYANQQQYDKLLQAGYQPKLQTPPSLREEAKMWDGNRATYEWDSYPTYYAYQSMMEAFPSQAQVTGNRSCTLLDLGTLNSGRKILGVRLNNGQPDGKPKFLFGSTIHGDETTGWILLLRLIDELCTSTDNRIVNLVNNLDIFVFPNMNSDGTYNGGNNTVNNATRANANGIDMNRNYPDPHGSTHPDNKAYQTETQWFMTLAETYPFVMAASFHGGAEVVNYPWDNTYTRHADDAWWQYVSQEYANLCHAVSSSYMTTASSQGDTPSGITNGADWYMISGGHQDYMNGYRQCREVTVECSTTKMPSGSQLPNFWNYNHNSMLAYMEQCLNGVHGFVYDASTNQPINGVTVTVLNHDDQYSIVSTHSVGDFHRPIKGGTWTFKFTKEGYCDESVTVSVADGQRKDLQVFLTPTGMSDYFHFITAGDWNTNTNWFGNTIPNSNGHVTIHANCTLDQDATVSSLTIENGNTLTVPSGKTLTVTSTLTDVSADNLVISEGGQLIHYNAGVLATVKKEITGYSGDDNGWNFIASPVTTPLTAAEVSGLIPSTTYDLYYLDEGTSKWRNYKVYEGNADSGFGLQPHIGYLYANQANTTISFSGAIQSDITEGIPFTLTNTGKGWNLVGNPFTFNAYVNKPYYTIGQAQEGIYANTTATLTSVAIAPCTGILVKADEAGTVTFRRTAFTDGAVNNGQLQMTLAQTVNSRGGSKKITLDNAIVSFNECEQLEKFYFGNPNANLYIPQGAEEYAIVSVGGRDAMRCVFTEIPVNLKVHKNGEYTLTVSTTANSKLLTTSTLSTT